MEESYAVLDVAGMNYAEARYELDRELFPTRIIVGTETWPTSIAGNWAIVKANGHVLGDFTWTGWDYLGETGIGATRYAAGPGEGTSPMPSAYPEVTAWCGDIDITGHRRAVSYFREIVFGLRHDPYIAVNPPSNHGRLVAVASPWAWGDAIESWSWSGCEGDPVTVDVYSDAEEIELLLNGVPVGRAPVESFRVSFEATYQPGELTAVSYEADAETGRFSITSAGADVVLQADVERCDLRADGTDLGYVDLTFTDGAGVVQSGLDRLVTVTVEGPASLQALGSGSPATTEAYTSCAHTTYGGRLLAVVRPTGTGSISVTAVAEGCPPATATLTSN
jgi:hypothetical protein